MYFSYIIVKSDIFAMKSIIHKGSDHFKIIRLKGTLNLCLTIKAVFILLAIKCKQNLFCAVKSDTVVQNDMRDGAGQEGQHVRR